MSIVTTINGKELYIEGPNHLSVLIAKSQRMYDLAMAKLAELETRENVPPSISDRVWAIAMRCDAQIADYNQIVL